MRRRPLCGQSASGSSRSRRLIPGRGRDAGLQRVRTTLQLVRRHDKLTPRIDSPEVLPGDPP